MKNFYSLMSSFAFLIGVMATTIDKPLTGIAVFLGGILLQLYAFEDAAPK